MLTSIDVKFTFDSARLGFSGSANVLQIASEISIILHMMRKPNSIIVLLFIQNNS